MIQIAGYILSGGKNRRMGGEKKAFLTLENQTFLHRISDALSVFPSIYLSVDHHEPYLNQGFTLIKDTYAYVGPLGAIYTGHTQCSEDALFVVACDMPFITKETVQKLLDVFHVHKKTVVAKTKEQLHPLLAIYPKEVLPIMKSMLDEDNYKMMDFLKRIDYEVVELDASKKDTMNINTKQEYEQLIKQKQMLSVEEAIDVLVKHTPFYEVSEEVALEDALGKVLAQDVISKYAQPPFPRSPLDGFALRGEDVKDASKQHPITLNIIGEVYAGGVFEGVVQEGCAVRIMTGAPIPDGANTVVKQEHTTYNQKVVHIMEGSKPFENYCPAGEDYEANEVILTKGTYIDGINIGVMASMGYDKVLVYKQPSIGIISTGDELILPGASLTKGKIYDANRYLIQARLKELGIQTVFSEHCKDDVEEMVAFIKDKAKDTQFIITTGGVSVGVKDIMHEAVEQLQAEKLFWKVDVKPGSPTLAAVYENTLLVCLSGNPFGAAVNFELLVRSVIAKLTNHKQWNMKKKLAILQDDFPKQSKKRRFIRGYYQDGFVSLLDANQSSSILSTFIGCNCFIDIEAGNQGLHKGDQVWIHLL